MFISYFPEKKQRLRTIQAKIVKLSLKLVINFTAGIEVHDVEKT